MAIFYFIFGWIDTVSYILFVAALFAIIPIVNNFASHRIGRMMFCLIPVWLTIFVTLFFKLEENTHTYIFYFDSRFILMTTPILPGLVFRLEERLHLYICIGSSLVTMLFYDPIHELFGVGYFQVGFNDPSYYYINYIAGVAFLMLVAGILLLRSVMEHGQKLLEEQNRELQHKQYEIEAQHEELLQHQEEMASSSESLAKANDVITKQQAAMEKYNVRLEALVAKKSQELRRANEELIKHNNELIQFSYTVSHNLRGPVARLLGLARLFKVSDRPEEKKHMEDLVVKATEELDEILKDLSLIIDIRNDLYKVREKVFLQEEWNKACGFLAESLKPQYRFNVNFSKAPYIFGVRPMIQSIFYNLLSNAIKYNDPERPLEVNVHAQAITPLKTAVEISDNGLGIDLKHQEKDIFKLYKRFHSHVPGKGLGLYLVKTQVEALGGKIAVQSEPDKGTTFKLIFTQPDEVSKQVFHENDAVQIYYNANLKITVIMWKKSVSSKEYREAFQIMLDSLKIYKTPGWISDVSKQGQITDDDQRWLIQTIAPEAIKGGLKFIAVVGFSDPERASYYSVIRKASSVNNINLQVFNSMDNALKWMHEILS